MKKTLFVIDAYNLFYRMFYAIPEMNTHDGQPVNAIFWVAKFLKGLADENPEASLIVANDVGRSFRSKLFIEYKAQRDRMPDNLKSQIEWVFSLFHAADIAILSQEWYEADDIIGSLAYQHEHDDYQVVIVSSDKDLCQFIYDGKIHIYDAMKRKFMKRSDVVEKFGVPPEQVCDYLAIVWDSSDNIPGISWFGPKKAVDLLSKYHTLEGIYENLDEISPKMQEILEVQKENAFLSQKLATIVTDLTIEKFSEIPFALWMNNEKYITLLKWYEFRSLLPKEHLEEKKSLSKKESIEITSLSDLSNLLGSIRKSKKIFLSIWEDIMVYIWVDENIYSLDPRIMDVREFIDTLLHDNTLEIIWYDLKEDYKKLMRIQKPLDNAVEGQGRLF